MGRQPTTGGLDEVPALSQDHPAKRARRAGFYLNKDYLVPVFADQIQLQTPPTLIAVKNPVPLGREQPRRCRLALPAELLSRCCNRSCHAAHILY